jgi:hypothetical protein
VVKPSIPVDTWGTIHGGDMNSWKVIIHDAANGGWDICLFPPPPSTDVWYHWANDEEDLRLWFHGSELDAQESSAWVWPGYLRGTEWNTTGVDPEDPRLRPGQRRTR